MSVLPLGDSEFIAFALGHATAVQGLERSQVLQMQLLAILAANVILVLLLNESKMRRLILWGGFQVGDIVSLAVSAQPVGGGAAGRR